MRERWLPVVGWEGLYEVSNFGQIRSLDRPPRDGRRGFRGRVLKPDSKKHGHRYVVLGDRDRVEKMYVHRAVLIAFDRPPAPGEEVRHWDGNPSNNERSNLLWGTKSDQRADDVRNGVHPSARKTDCPRGHALVEPNLVACEAEAGHRACRACSRARARAKRSGVAFTKELADWEYDRLMEAA